MSDSESKYVPERTCEQCGMPSPWVKMCGVCEVANRVDADAQATITTLTRERDEARNEATRNVVAASVVKHALAARDEALGEVGRLRNELNAAVEHFDVVLEERNRLRDKAARAVMDPVLVQQALDDRDRMYATLQRYEGALADTPENVERVARAIYAQDWPNGLPWEKISGSEESNRLRTARRFLRALTQQPPPSTPVAGTAGGGEEGSRG